MPLHWIVLLIVPGLVFGWPAALLAYVTVSCLSSLMTASVFIPNHIGMRRLDAGARGQLPRAAGHHQPKHRQPAAARLLLRRPQLPDRAPPLPRGSPTTAIATMRPIVRALLRRARDRLRQDTLYRALASVGNHLGDMTAAYLRERQAAAAPPAGPAAK